MYDRKSHDLMDRFGGKDTSYEGRCGDDSAEGVDFPRFPSDKRDIPILEGGEDSDTVYGGPYSNIIDAGRNDNPVKRPFARVESSFGGGGNDHFWAVDDHIDVVNCGQDELDSVYIDLYDTEVTNCGLNAGF